MTGIAPVHAGANLSVVDDREWLEEGEFSGGTEELLESKKLEVVEGIIGEAMAANAELPDRSVCHDASLVHSFNVPKGMVIYQALYNQLLEVKKKIHERILKWQEQKICKPAKPRNLNNLPLLLVAKVESGKVMSKDYRVCLDARPLNVKNWSKQFTLPKISISDIIKKATKVTMMVDLDLKGVFHQVLLDEVSSELSAFMDLLTGERYQMTNMWFGESGSATQMQKVVHAVLGIGEPGTENWRVYVDNMLVLYEGEDVVEFAHQVKRLVEKLTVMGMKLKLAKCKVGYTRMRILGHLCEKGSAQIDPEKVKCFSEMERPKSLQALRLLLGFLNYVRDYVPLISDLLGPFQELAKKRKWDDSLWGGELNDLFQRVQRVLESAPVLSALDFAEPFILATDTSQYGVGTVLYQKIRGVMKFVRFGAKSLKKGQKNYLAPKRELLALLFGLKRWGELLQPQRFTVEVDHKALIHLQLERSYMARDWMNYMAGYDFVVTHCPGVQHVLLHHLSHLYGILPGGEREERERVYEEKRKEGEVRRREEVEERRAKRGGQGEKRGEVVEIAEMTTRAMRRREGEEEKGKEKEEEEGKEGEGGEREGEREEAGQGGVGRGGGEAEWRENERSGESSEEGEKRAVGLVEVAGGPQGALRSLEKVFGVQTAESLIFLFLGFLSANNHTKKHSRIP